MAGASTCTSNPALLDPVRSPQLQLAITTNSIMVIFSSLDQTRASIQSLYPQSMCHLLPVVQLSDHLHMCKAASLVWIDLPRRYFRLENLRNVFQRLTEAIDPRSVATVITMTNVNNRFSRTSEVAQALQPFHRSPSLSMPISGAFTWLGGYIYSTPYRTDTDMQETACPRCVTPQE